MSARGQNEKTSVRAYVFPVYYQHRNPPGPNRFAPFVGSVGTCTDIEVGTQGPGMLRHLRQHHRRPFRRRSGALNEAAKSLGVLTQLRNLRKYAPLQRM